MYSFIKENPLAEAILAAAVLSGLILLSLVAFEPLAGRAATTTSQFTVTQTINNEISFATAATNVTMSGALNGITGGTSNGSTQAIVRTNNSAGYSMTIDFASSTYGTAAMNQNGGSGYISDYTPTGANPDFTYTPETYAQFGYTVSASTTGDIVTKFRNNGISCGTAGSDTIASCWYGPSTTPETLINRTSATGAGGEGAIIHFRVNLPSNPSPSVPSGTYTATATLTAFEN